MHVFQPFNIEDVDINPFKKLKSEWALVTSGTQKKYNTMTVSWGGFGVLWNKNVAFIFIRESRYTKVLLDSHDFFSISFLSGAYKDALEICGSQSGRDVDKFEKAGLTPAFRHKIPYPDEANFVLLCNKLVELPIPEEKLGSGLLNKFYKEKDFHTMYVAEIIESMAR